MRHGRKISTAAAILLFSIAAAAAGGSLPQSEALVAAKAVCEAQNVRGVYKCDCLMEYFAEQHERHPERNTTDLLADAQLAAGDRCADSEAGYRINLYQCADNFPYFADDKMNQLGLPSYCHCVADKAMKRPMAEGYAACKQVTEYPVPNNSPLVPPPGPATP